ncbi:MAG: ATP synthase F1 subunit delta [Candidatus Eremiobacteraeota bacterium]|nr:ATP synthase F1 subunit delta [Candidatus Eremiobacteraeota bacterium]
MIVEALARRYASAVFSLAREAGKTEAIGRDLGAVAAAISDDEELRTFYASPVIDRAEKTALLAKAFGGKVDDIVLHLLLLLVRKRRENYLRAISAEYGKLLLEEQGLEPLEVVAARPLTADELKAIVDRVSRKYAKHFKVNYKVDSSLGAGIQLQMGDRYIDGSLSGKINELARALFAQT